MPRLGPSYSKEQAAEAIAASKSFTEALRRLGICGSGGALPVLRKWAARWGLSTDHFDPAAAQRAGLGKEPKPLDEVLVERSTYGRGYLKARLLAEGLKKPACEMCGQDELWQGRPMSLILDHVNGVRDDHRLDNLRIVCPNCAATLETHCGRRTRLTRAERHCARCDAPFYARSSKQRYCSRECGTRWDRRARPQPGARRVARPTLQKLIEEIDRLGYCGAGRRYGVSDNAIRKWVRQYEREAERAERA